VKVFKPLWKQFSLFECRLSGVEKWLSSSLVASSCSTCTLGCPQESPYQMIARFPNMNHFSLFSPEFYLIPPRMSSSQFLQKILPHGDVWLGRHLSTNIVWWNE
jgi:hypothetical protein